MQNRFSVLNIMRGRISSYLKAMAGITNALKWRQNEDHSNPIPSILLD